LLLARVLAGEVERRLRVAIAHIGAGGIDVGEVGSERPALEIDEPVRGDDQIEEAGGGSDEHRERDQPHAFAGEPVTASQKFARPLHVGSVVGRVAPALGQPTLNGALSGLRSRAAQGAAPPRGLRD
jgi:hypothetical protein